MKKGISFYYGFDSKAKIRTEKIAKAGFDCVITCFDKRFDDENGKAKQQVRQMKKNKLLPSSLHMAYKEDELIYFWKDCKIGDNQEKSLIRDVKLAKKYGFSCVVVHLIGEPNEIGYDRLRRILKVCEKTKIPLAIENINDQNCFLKTFDNVKSEYMLFCYDAGHNHLFDPDFDYLTEFKDKLICLHLHSNYGDKITDQQMIELNDFHKQKDLHTLNKYGDIDWKEIAKKLAKIPREINLDYEIFMIANKNETEEVVLEEVYKQACELEEMIQHYKNQ